MGVVFSTLFGVSEDPAQESVTHKESGSGVRSGGGTSVSASPGGSSANIEEGCCLKECQGPAILAEVLVDGTVGFSSEEPLGDYEVDLDVDATVEIFGSGVSLEGSKVTGSHVQRNHLFNLQLLGEETGSATLSACSGGRKVTFEGDYEAQVPVVPMKSPAGLPQCEGVMPDGFRVITVATQGRSGRVIFYLMNPLDDAPEDYALSIQMPPGVVANGVVAPDEVIHQQSGDTLLISGQFSHAHTFRVMCAVYFKLTGDDSENPITVCASFGEDYVSLPPIRMSLRNESEPAHRLLCTGNACFTDLPPKCGPNFREQDSFALGNVVGAFVQVAVQSLTRVDAYSVKFITTGGVKMTGATSNKGTPTVAISEDAMIVSLLGGFDTSDMTPGDSHILFNAAFQGSGGTIRAVVESVINTGNTEIIKNSRLSIKGRWTHVVA